MKFEFKIGVFVGSLLLINIQMCIVSMIMVGAAIIKGMYYPLSILGVAYLCIGAIGHVRATWYSMGDIIDDPNLLGKPLEDPKSFAQALNLARNPVTLGVTWRIKKEFEYMKKTANFEFKSKSE